MELESSSDISKWLLISPNSMHIAILKIKVKSSMVH